MQKHSFASFDIDSFYPSITESLLSKTISFAKNYTTISEKRHRHNYALSEITFI